MSGRQVFFGKTSHLHNTTKYVSNQITTARYNLFTFLPIQLFEQFKKAANVYFLFIGLLQQVPNLSPTGQYTTIGPLAIFVALSMIREAYDDVKRHRQDRRENERESEVLVDSVFHSLCSLFPSFLCWRLIPPSYDPIRSGNSVGGGILRLEMWSESRKTSPFQLIFC
jgi:hypothetical protein